MSTAALFLAIPGVAAVMFLVLRLKRGVVYARLRRQQSQMIDQIATGAERWFTPPTALPFFSRRLVSLANLLPMPILTHLQSVVAGARRDERSYIPGHKQGGTISYEQLHALGPELVAFYQSRVLRDLVSDLVGVRVVPTPLHDQSSCSLLIYDRPRDHIGWHYDHNFYRGRHFTVLLCLLNEDRIHGGLSSAHLQARIGGRDEVIPTPPNTLVVFEGAQVLHRVTGLGPGQTRVQLSMTYCTDPSAPWYKALIRRGKDMAYFGIRALWT
ncbi:MAG: 2OG-Fe(II) oxygenase [Planctomycetes bacterium]|nr:2OG-Fe(II) oxygenase [Planctomycetota bacterium]